MEEDDSHDTVAKEDDHPQSRPNQHPDLHAHSHSNQHFSARSHPPETRKESGHGGDNEREKGKGKEAVYGNRMVEIVDSDSDED